MSSILQKLTVRTLDEHRLANATADLAAQVEHFKAATFHPDLLIGIRSGGFIVAETMAPKFPGVTLLPITCRRPSTKKKQDSSLLKQWLRKLPDSITSRLRILEHILLTQFIPAKSSTFIPDKAEMSAIENFLKRFHGNPSILIVDDAVDSGATLATVVGMVRHIAGPKAVIKTAVITVTTTAPFIEPDFLLYRYVLCRFPWSFDFKS